MENTSGLKKIQRAQRSGGARVPGQRRALGFPLAIGAIVIIGLVSIALAREGYRDAANAAPLASGTNGTGDHFHNAYGIYICDHFIEPLKDAIEDVGGIHAHGDGLIHIHPYQASFAGKNAVFGKFLAGIGVKVTDSTLTLPATASESNKDFKSGDTCTIDGKKQKAELRLVHWPVQASDKTKPKDVLTSDFNDDPIRIDGEAVVLAFTPKSVPLCVDKPKADPCVGLPPSMKTLQNPADLNEPNTGTTTTAVGATSTTAAGAATTAAGANTTAAPSTTAAVTTAAPSTTAG